jgi:hypothetical protein
MSKNIILSSLLILVLFLIIYFIFFRVVPLKKVSFNLNNTNYEIEIAKTISQKSKGLSNRQNLCSNCGMLFVFGFETKLPFWMKDTNIPLDMIWLDKNGKIVEIKNANETNNSQKIYQNQIPAQYVLELNINDSQKLNLKIGDIIQIPDSI